MATTQWLIKEKEYIIHKKIKYSISTPNTILSIWEAYVLRL